MKQRIKECWLKAAKEDSDPDNWDTQEQFIERFAELIVRDCCQVLQNWKGEPFPFDEDVAVSLIKEHFGIKE